MWKGEGDRAHMRSHINKHACKHIMTLENTGVANIYTHEYIYCPNLVPRFEALKVYTHVVLHARAAQHARKVDNHDQLYNNSRSA